MVSDTEAGEINLSTFIPDDKHRQVLKTCVDVPEESPAVPLPLERVGISGKTIWVSLAENNGGHVPFDASILVSLAADRRGIHMSRIEQAITALYDKIFASLSEYGRELTQNILQAQKIQSVSLEMTGSLPYLRQAPVSKLMSVDSLEVYCKTTREKNGAKAIVKTCLGAVVYHLTACPCTQSYNEILFDRTEDPWPQITHSQRSKTKLQVSPPPGARIPDYRELLEILTTSLHLSQDLLKRPDETELVLKAHKTPQFAEDTAREVAKAAVEKFKNTLAPETRIQVHSHSLESIHIHDVECFLDMSLSDILAALQTAKKEYI
jgi:GTP cyclohydrolase FolE2